MTLENKTEDGSKIYKTVTKKNMEDGGERKDTSKNIYGKDGGTRYNIENNHKNPPFEKKKQQRNILHQHTMKKRMKDYPAWGFRGLCMDQGEKKSRRLTELRSENMNASRNEVKSEVDKRPTR